METGITNNEYYKHDTKKWDHDPENLIEMRQMTLHDSKFDIKKSLDTLKDVNQITKG